MTEKECHPHEGVALIIRRQMQQDINAIKDYLLTLQSKICTDFALADGQVDFQTDHWQHHTGGGGITRTISGGRVFEKGGVNFSHVAGDSLPPAATKLRPQLVACQFQALGVSIVMHPINPYVPTSHANIRFFVAEKPGMSPLWWFGGGFDLTPYYGFIDDCKHWHRQAKQACDPFGTEVYPHYKQWCDDYFYLKHRDEARGIGGLFFDDLNQWDFSTCFAFMRSVGDHYSLAYLPIVERRKDHVYTERERQFQYYRRGRYVEFNLIYDRGTLFGLQSGGRVESILMSLPPQVNWQYNWQAQANSSEAQLCHDFLRAKDWLADDE